MRHTIYSVILSAGATLLVTSCSVYAPLQPAAPRIHKKGDAEVASSAYLSGRYEGSVAYSPAKHVLVRAAGGLRTDAVDSTSNYFRIRQFELGAGSYHSFSERWLIGGMLGYGYGRSGRRFRQGGFESISDTTITREYAARFHKLYAEGYVAHDTHWSTKGVACRVSQVRFASLKDQGTPVPLRRMTRIEPLVFFRFGGRRISPWLQFQVASSFSWSPDERRNSSSDARIRDLKEERLFTSVGLVIYPHRFRE